MKNRSFLARFGTVVLVLLAFVLIIPSAKIDLTSKIRASTQASVHTEHLQNFASQPEMNYQVFSADDPVYQQISQVLSGIRCVRRFRQNDSAYSHEYPVDSITVGYYDAAGQHPLLFTVYSDGVCIVNSEFVNMKYSGGRAEELYQELRRVIEEG